MSVSELRDSRPGPGNRVTLSRIVGAVVAVWTCLRLSPGPLERVRRLGRRPHVPGEPVPSRVVGHADARCLGDSSAGRVHAGDVDDVCPRPGPLGSRHRGYHLTSLGLHVATTLGVYAVAGRLLALARGGRLDERGRIVAAAVAALAFGVHPLRAEPVAWLSARGTVLGGCLLVLAVLAYLVGWERGRVEGRVPKSWLGLVAGLFVASILARATSWSCLPCSAVDGATFASHARRSWPLGRACDSPCPGGEAWARRSGRARDPDGLSRA